MLFWPHVPKVGRVGRDVQKRAKTFRNILNGLDQLGGNKPLLCSLWRPWGLVNLVGRTRIVPVSMGQPAWAEPSEEVIEVAQGHSVWHKVSRWLAVTWPLTHHISVLDHTKALQTGVTTVSLGSSLPCSPKGYLQPGVHCG